MIKLGMRIVRRRSRGGRRLDPCLGARIDPLEPRLLLAVDVLTYHNDAARDGDDLAEATLTPADVNASQFGKLGQVAVDGPVFAQPLVKTGVSVPGGGTQDLVFIATENDSVYAFNAETLAPVWHQSFVNPSIGITPVPDKDTGAYDVYPQIGITSTPVIDPTTGTLYVEAETKSVVGRKASYAHTLHALDLGTGREKLGGPVVITGSVPGTGSGSARGKLTFNPLHALQRPALLLSGGSIYIAFGSHGDIGPYHGWVFGYDAATLKQSSIFNDTPNGLEGGIWMAGNGPAADAAGNIYVADGNGTFDGGKHPRDVGDSVMKLAKIGSRLALQDYYTPPDQAKLNRHDLDFGTSGALILPDQPGAHAHELITGGKDGTIVVVDRDAMGQYSPKHDTAVQTITGPFKGLFSEPTYFNGKVYVAGTAGQSSQGTLNPLLAYSLVDGRLSTTPQQSTVGYGYPGTSPSISANGTADGIIWTLDNHATAAPGGPPAILRAFDADDITHLLYDSSRSGTRDQSGPGVKFTSPTIANGRVYVGGNGAVTMYGLLG